LREETLQRTCIGCGTKGRKDKLLRFTISMEGTLLLDVMQSLQGRGGYLCPQKMCFRMATKKRRLSHRLHRDFALDFEKWIREVKRHLLDFIHENMERLKPEIIEENDVSGMWEKMKLDEAELILFPLTASGSEKYVQLGKLRTQMKKGFFFVPSEITGKGMIFLLKKPGQMRRLHQAIVSYLSLSSEGGTE
jgi:predicted RNA-binding protein YlxR (DUF448 family)